MASIPTYTAQGVNVRPRTPSHISVPESGLAEAGAAIGQIGKVAAEHAGYLQNQKDTIDFQFMRSQLDANLQNTKLNLQNDPEIYDTPDSFVKKFGEQARDAITVVTENSKASDYAKNLFRNYAVMRLPEQLVRAKAEGRTLFAKNEVQRLDNLKEVMSDDAVNAETSQDRVKVMGAFTEEVTKATPRSLDPAHAADKIYDFEQLVAEKTGRKLANGTEDQRETWRELARTGKTGIKNTDTIQRISNMAQIKEEHIDRKTKQVMADANKIMMGYSFGLAMYGQLPDSFIEDVAQQKIPGLTPQEGLHLKEVNDNAPLSGATLEVRNIITEMATRPGQVTLQRVEEAKANLRTIMMQNGRSSKEIETQSKGLEALGLHLRSVQAAEMQAGMHLGEELLKASRTPSIIPGIPAHMEANKFNQMMSELKVWRMKNPTASNDEIAKKTIELRNQKFGDPNKPKSESDKKLQNLMGQ